MSAKVLHFFELCKKNRKKNAIFSRKLKEKEKKGDKSKKGQIKDQRSHFDTKKTTNKSIFTWKMCGKYKIDNFLSLEGNSICKKSSNFAPDF